MQQLWNNLISWFQSKGGFAHAVAAAYVAAVAAYAAVPSFQTLVNDVYNVFPSWLKLTAMAAIGLLAWYKDTNNLTLRSASKMAKLSVWIGVAMLSLGTMTLLTGCAGLPTWLTDAENILPQFLISAGGLLTLIGTLTGNPEFGVALATITGIVNEMETGIKTVQEMVAQYKELTSGETQTTLLSKIEDAAQAVISNAGSLLQDFGLPTAVSQPFTALAQLILSQFENWISTLPALQAKAGDRLTLTVPMSVKEFRIAVAAALDKATPSGDDKVDVALAEIRKRF